MSPARGSLWEVSLSSVPLCPEDAQALRWGGTPPSPFGSGAQGRMRRWLLAPGCFSGLSELETGSVDAGRGPEPSHPPLPRPPPPPPPPPLPPPADQQLSYVQVAIDSMAQQCCCSAHGVPENMGFFSKLDLIQMKTPRCPAWPPTQARPGSQLMVPSWLAALLASPSMAAWAPGTVGLRVFISLSANITSTH